MQAAYDGNKRGLEPAELLVNNGADVTAPGASDGDKESTPLWWAEEAEKKGKEHGVALVRLLQGSAPRW